jgi:hypothetical protein
MNMRELGATVPGDTIQHRCADGVWKPGRTRHCAACKDAGVKRPVKVKGRLET